MEKALEAILIELVGINKRLESLSDRIDSFTFDLREFSDRFEEVMTEIENERRLDQLNDYN